ncbi:flagellar protein [Thermococcus sp. M36]|uniref:FlaD/FlaE family flagellar protein n=1 Tax=Thermococcus sp. M36 TaxID=1638261 RepID=UPI00143C776A|nr:FlaD/FlaE family flagellar protein [Thermococcus sp. M36]NJE04847.1 flagellar protein [Thermococcus sp. M36]
MITEVEIDERLKRLRGKVPNFLIEDLKGRLMKKKDILTPEQVDRVVDRVLQVYTGQIEKLSRLDSRVEEIGRYLEEIRNQLLNLSQSQSGLPEVNGGRNASAGEAPSGSVGDILDSKGSLDPSRGSPAVESETATGALNASAPDSREVGQVEREFEVPKGFDIPQDIKNLLISPSDTKARLERIPTDMVSTMMALKWLGFLIDRVGMQNLENVLEFYYQIGWISEEVLYTLLRYAEGIRPHHRESDWRPDEKLTIQDHLVSLLFIERLRGVRITREVMDAIEREMRIIGRVLEDVYGV